MALCRQHSGSDPARQAAALPHSQPAVPPATRTVSCTASARAPHVPGPQAPPDESENTGVREFMKLEQQLEGAGEGEAGEGKAAEEPKAPKQASLDSLLSN